MALEGMSACLKYLLIVWNFIVLVLGIAILGVGVWMKVDEGSGQFIDSIVPEDSPVIINYSNVANSSMFASLSYILIAFGAITVIIAFLGYCGAMRESQCLLGTCFTFLFLIFAALLGTGVYLYVNKDEIDVDREKLYPLLKKVLKDAVANYHDNDEAKNFMDAIQTKYDCCGADNGVIDYAISLDKPDTCGILNIATPCLPPYYDHVASEIGIKQFFNGKMTIGMGILLGVSGSLILAMILTLCLCCAVKRTTRGEY